jgi:hypothetical protein
VCLEWNNYWKVEVLKLQDIRQEDSKFECPAAPPDTDPCELERFSINDVTSSGSLLPIVSKPR